MTQPFIVLADDLTGATELAGVALRFGFNARVLTQAEACSSAVTDARTVLCYDADTRRLSAEAAAARTAALAAALAADHPRLFKKTDSLLRGHPAAEIESLLQISPWRRAVLCPANPSRGRTIRQGNYYVGGILLAQSALANDPEYPRTSSKVSELLDSSSPAIEVPDVATAEDLRCHASRLATDVLPAGGAEFFEAILRSEGCTEQRPSQPVLPAPWLLVCGSRTGWQQGRQQQADAHRIPCLLVDALEQAAFRRELKARGAVWLAVGEPAEQAPAGHWLDLLAREVAHCLGLERVGTLFLEGGATARAILDRCGWRRFEAVGELAPGCVAMRADDRAAPLVVTKPGSYPWPDSLWTQ